MLGRFRHSAALALLWTIFILPSDQSCQMSIDPRTLSALLVDSAVEAQDLAGSFCPRVHRPSSLEFLKDFVHTNRPCVITGAIDHWPALSKWADDSYLIKRFGDHKVKINATPNGRGDAILDGKYFMLPEEREMTYGEFVRKKGQGSDVLYLSHQCDNLRVQLEGIIQDDVDVSLPVADAALGCGPDAVNLWAGDANAITTLHKDHYENMYAVVRGAKHFTLYPPTSLPLLYPMRFPVMQHRKIGDAWTVAVPPDGGLGGDGGAHQWIAADPQSPDYSSHPDFEKAIPVKVTVRPGEVLFLPSMWYHQVGQNNGSCAAKPPPSSPKPHTPNLKSKILDLLTPILRLPIPTPLPIPNPQFCTVNDQP